MIKFFRKIRQKLLSEKKFSKYLIYAVGEIILVVVGILIALSINNWNDERKDNLKGKNILQQLKTEFKRDSIDLSNYVKLTNKKITDGKILKTAIESKRVLSKDTLAFCSFFNGKILLFKGFIPTFDELISSGSQNLIPDKLSNEIKRYLNILNTSQTFSYFEKQQTKLAYNNHLHKYFDSEIMTYLWENTRSKTIKLEEINAFNMNTIGFYEDPETLLHIRNVIGVDSELEWEYSGRIMTLISSILGSIDEELKK